MIDYVDLSLDEKFKKIDSLNWLPFIGKNYFNEKFKILVVGESHYIPVDEDAERYNKSTWTREFILKDGLQVKPWYNGEKKNNLVREIEKTLLGYTSNKIWKNVSYFNLIQRLLPSIEKQNRPTYEDFKYGLNIFKIILGLLDSDLVIFCGVEGANHFQNILQDENFVIEKIKLTENKINRTYPKSFQLKFNEKSRICYFIKHPSKFYSSDKWREYLAINYNI